MTIKNDQKMDIAINESTKAIVRLHLNGIALIYFFLLNLMYYNCNKVQYLNLI